MNALVVRVGEGVINPIVKAALIRLVKSAVLEWAGLSEQLSRVDPLVNVILVHEVRVSLLLIISQGAVAVDHRVSPVAIRSEISGRMAWETGPRLLLRVVNLHELFDHAEFLFRLSVVLHLLALLAILAVHADDDNYQGDVEENEHDELEPYHLVARLTAVLRWRGATFKRERIQVAAACCILR